MRAQITVSSAVDLTPRVLQASSMFDVPVDEKLTRTWDLDVPLEERDWNIGLIVGPSGSGKSTAARHLWPEQAARTVEWPADRALVDCFDTGLSIRDIVGALNSVGLSSTPAWLRPFTTLSGGEQFRATVARSLMESPELAVVDEFTSTVDRHVAQVVSAATAKYVRRRGSQLVAVTCHYDIEDWLQPDWVLQPHIPSFTWRSVQPRPAVRLDIHEVDAPTWKVFRVHHYLSAQMVPGSKYYGGFINGEMVAFAAVAHVPSPYRKARKIRRVRRLVVLPDWQGLGIGTRMEEYLAELYCSQGYRFRSVTTHPGLVRYYLRSPRWSCDIRPGTMSGSGKTSAGRLTSHQNSSRRLLCYGFEYHPRGIDGDISAAYPVL